MAKMKIIREVSKVIFEHTKKSKMKDDFDYHVLEEKYFMIAEKKVWLAFEKNKLERNGTI